MDCAHTLEGLLDLEKPWTTTYPEYKEAAVLHRKQCYQQCLNELESLVVSHLFD
jgi:hypothetical protein